MTYDRVLLAGLPQCRQEIKDLDDRLKWLCIKSRKVSEGAFYDLACVAANLRIQRDTWQEWWNIATDVLCSMDNESRGLLLAERVAKVPKKEVARKLGWVLSKVYKRTDKAWHVFSARLAERGCNAEWFNARFTNTPWVATMLAQ